MKSSGKRFDVAVFPLANAVLFPGVSLPLHIFEKRYEQMLEDIQARGWQLAISLAVPYSQTEFVLSSICGAGPIQISKQYPDGASDILVHGRQRVKLCQVLQYQPYMVMEAEALEMDPKKESQLMTTTRSLDEFRALVKAWVFLNPKVPDQVAPVFDDFKSVGEVCDFFVFHFLKKPQDKQVYLNCTNPFERAEMLAQYLETDLVRLSKKLTQIKKSMVLH